MQNTVVIDCFPESAVRYQGGWAIVAIDVIRATTTAVTAAAGGWRCYPAPTIKAAFERARTFDNTLLAGESGGDIPPGFEMDNSPAQVAARRDTHRPLVLVSSSGTRVIHEAAGADAIYLTCFRNFSAVSAYVAGKHARVAVIGAGSKGEFREEDQACCAWVGEKLVESGYRPQDQATEAIVGRWSGRPAEACLGSHSVDFLKRTNRLPDLEFIFSHIDDVQRAVAVSDGEVRLAGDEDESCELVSVPTGYRIGPTRWTISRR